MPMAAITQKEGNIMTLKPSWDQACEVSLTAARKKAIEAGTMEALAAFDERLLRLYNQTGMSPKTYARHDAVVLRARINLGLSD